MVSHGLGWTGQKNQRQPSPRLLVDAQLMAQMAGLANVGASLLLHVTFVFVRSISFSRVYLQTWNAASFHHSSLASVMWLPEFT